MQSSTAGAEFQNPDHRAALKANALAQLSFFRNSLRSDGGFDVLNTDGTPIPNQPQQLMTTTRLVHSYCLGFKAGAPGCEEMIGAGMAALLGPHRDPVHGGYMPIVTEGVTASSDKLAYGHVFVLLASASAAAVDHPDANRLMTQARDVIDRYFWDEDAGLLRDEFRRDWSVFSAYRGMNANMHGTEAFLAAYEVTGDSIYLDRAGRILSFFIERMAAQNSWRIPEHYDDAWQVDATYEGDPMFRPAGTTPGHSFEFARLLLQHWDLSGREDAKAPVYARHLIETAMKSAWLPEDGLAYTLDFEGAILRRNRYWWPITEAIGAYASLLKLNATAKDLTSYHQLWAAADSLFIDQEKGGWFPEVDDAGNPSARQFVGKPDIYHALQACLFPMAEGLSRPFDGVRNMLA